MVLQTKNSVILILLSCLLMVACGKEEKISTVSIDASAIPTVHTENGFSLISDSGITRYSLEYKVWDMFSKAEDPYWYFPEGVYLEKFDSLFRAEGSIKADTAYYYESKGLWCLRGHVFIENLEGSTFETSELYWNEKEPPNSINSIYTDSFVRIDLGDRVVTGQHGMRTNQYMTRYDILEGGGEVFIDEESTKPSSQSNDTIQISTSREEIHTQKQEIMPVKQEKSQ